MNRKCLLIAVVIFLFFLVTYYLFPDFLLTLELRLHDNFFQVARYFKITRPSPNLNKIVIIALDDLSFWKMEKKWPFPRSVFADLLSRINQGEPKLIFFDIVFRGDSEDPKEDELFAESLKGESNILLPYHMGQKGVHVRSKKSFTEHTGQAGYINKAADPDGAVRRFYPFRLFIEGGVKDYAAEIYLFGKFYNYDLKKISVKNRCATFNDLKTEEKDKFKFSKLYLRNDNTTWINYQAAIGDFKVISMYKVFSEIKPEVFKDKVVFVGLTSDIFHDRYPTSFGMMPGTAIVANTALMFLDGNFLYEASFWLKWFLMLVLCFVMAFLAYRLGALKGFLFTASLIVIILTLTFWLFLNNYYLNPFKLILICIVSYIAINFYKYTSVVIENMSLRRLSTTDELTGLNVFRFFQIVINHEFQKCLRYKTPLSLLMIDIDNFKKINDTYGHQKGNVVLSKIGKIILNNIRKADFPARYGGEEMAILLPNSNIEGAQKCAENIRRLIENEEFFATNQGPFHATVSIGVSSFPAMNIASTEEMVKFADAALYKAKREGKNRAIIYSEGMQSLQ